MALRKVRIVLFIRLEADVMAADASDAQNRIFDDLGDPLVPDTPGYNPKHGTALREMEVMGGYEVTNGRT